MATMTMEQYNAKQSIYVVTDDAYEVLHESILMSTIHKYDGAPSVKKYLWTCPHKEGDCSKCNYFKNIFRKEQPRVVKESNGTLKPVLRLSEYQLLLGAGCLGSFVQYKSPPRSLPPWRCIVLGKRGVGLSLSLST